MRGDRPTSHTLAQWERDDDVAGLEFAAFAILDAVSDVACAIKPQVSYFERFGSRGFVVLERLILDARDAGVIVVADAKRGDFGPTNAGYAEAWLSEHSPLAVDAVTISPYLGIGAMSPLIETARNTGRGIFIVVATSNEEGRTIQTSRTSTGESVEDYLLRSIAEINEHDDPLGSVGAVVGATRDMPNFDLTMVRGPFLVPGVGAQGATSDNVAKLFGRCVPGSVLVNVSRAVSDAGPSKRSLRDVASRWRDELAAALV